MYSKINKQMNLSDYVRVYDNAMPAQMCQQLINRFEAEPENQVQRNNGIMNFTEINIVQSDWYMEPFFKLMLKYRQQYWADCGINDLMINPDHDWEDIRMKRYSADRKEEFSPHNDTWDLATARRFIVYFWYLNDVEVGGETELFRLDRPMKVQPRQGRLIMFPTTWQYLHAGLQPISGDKYIVGGYLHYK